MYHVKRSTRKFTTPAALCQFVNAHLAEQKKRMLKYWHRTCKQSFECDDHP